MDQRTAFVGLIACFFALSCAGRSTSLPESPGGGAGPTGAAGQAGGAAPIGSVVSPAPTSSATPGRDAATDDASVDVGIADASNDTDQPWEVQQLDRIRSGVLGTWAGTQTNPWSDPCPVTITFGAASYSAHSPGDACTVFYWGVNDDSPEKTYLIDDVTASAEGTGEIAIYFQPGDTNRGVLEHIALSADNQQLTFQTLKDDYGPLVFTLSRAPQP
jgi:hypothetical protein